MADEIYLYLTTLGRKSGNPHTIEIWFVAHDGRYYLVSENCERSHWVQNILKTPQVTFSVGTREDRAAILLPTLAMGSVITASDNPDVAQAISMLMDGKYGWSDGLIIQLTPIPSA